MSAIPACKIPITGTFHTHTPTPLHFSPPPIPPLILHHSQVIFHILDHLERGRRPVGPGGASLLPTSPTSPAAAGTAAAGSPSAVAQAASFAADPGAWLRRAGTAAASGTAGRLDQMDISGSYLVVTPSVSPSKHKSQ